jgi:hypothetical protein
MKAAVAETIRDRVNVLVELNQYVKFHVSSKVDWARQNNLPHESTEGRFHTRLFARAQAIATSSVKPALFARRSEFILLSNYWEGMDVVASSKADSVYNSIYEKSDGVSAQQTLDEIQDKCLQEHILKDVVAKNPVLLALGTKPSSSEGRDDTLWSRYLNTPIPMITIENVPKTCK